MADGTPTSAGKVQLNLDSLEREQVVGLQEKRPEKFAVVFAGERIEFEDPAELPWETVARMDETPTRFFRSTMSPEHWAHFNLHSRELSGWKLRALMDAYRDYYGIDDQGNVVGSRR